MDHPMIKQIERTGYPAGYEERKLVGSDFFGNEVYTGDEVLVLNDEIFLIEALISETIEVLEFAGAERRIV